MELKRDRWIDMAAGNVAGSGQSIPQGSSMSSSQYQKNEAGYSCLVESLTINCRSLRC